MRLELHATDIVLFLPAKMQRAIEPRLGPSEVVAPNPADPARLSLTLPFRVSTSRGRTEVIAGVSSGSCAHLALIGALRAAHALTDNDGTGNPSITIVPASSYERRLIGLAVLAPDIQEAILAGHQPARLNLADLTDHDLPVLWSEQRKMLGWATKS